MNEKNDKFDMTKILKVSPISHCQKNEKASHKLGYAKCTSDIWTYIQNIFKKKKHLKLNNKKQATQQNIGKRLEQTLYQRKYVNGKLAPQKKLNIISH